MTRQEAYQALTDAIDDYVALKTDDEDMKQILLNASDAEEEGKQIGQEALRCFLNEKQVADHIEEQINDEALGWSADELKIMSCAAYYEVACQKEDNHVG